MTFSSIQFMVFFPIVFLLYLIIPRKIRCIFLLCVSYIYYICYLDIMYGHVWYIFCLIGATIITYIVGLLLGKKHNRKKSLKKEKRLKRIILIIAIIINIGALVFFKYNFYQIKDLFLPIGMSYFTFSSLSYIIDVYRNETRPETNIITYSLYVSFFPIIFSGPIERSKNLLVQIKNIEKIKVWSYENFSSGLILLAWGYFQKFVIVSRCEVFANAVFENYTKYGSIECFMAFFIYGFQIYLDFMSYSLIALGLSRFFGFSVIDNFRAPYLSTSIKSFWRKWHISLTSWLRDYVYIPLGGNRSSFIRRNLNILIVFLISGMWHGATYNFIIWGVLHGIYQVLENIFAPIKRKIETVCKFHTDCFSYILGEIFVTFILINFSWVFFRCETLESAFGFIRQMFSNFNIWVLFDKSIYDIALSENEMHILVVTLIMVILVDLVRFVSNKTIDVFLKEQNIWFEWIVILMLIVGTIVFGYYGAKFNPSDFIYFQF